MVEGWHSGGILGPSQMDETDSTQTNIFAIIIVELPCSAARVTKNYLLGLNRIRTQYVGNL
jgi:hypothetical protein